MQIEHHKNGAEAAFYARWNSVLQRQKSSSKCVIIISIIMCFLSTPKQTAKTPGTEASEAATPHRLSLAEKCRPRSSQEGRAVIHSFFQPTGNSFFDLPVQPVNHSVIKEVCITVPNSIGNWGSYHSDRCLFKRPNSHDKPCKIDKVVPIQVLLF